MCVFSKTKALVVRVSGGRRKDERKWVINKITNRFQVPVLASQSKCLVRRAKAKKEKTGLRLLREGWLAKRLLHAWPMALWRSYKASSWRYVKDALRGGEVSGPLDTALQ